MTAPLSPSDLAEIEAVAKAATPGPWLNVMGEIVGPMGLVADSLSASTDAAHIARTDPATTLALLADLARARDAVARVREVAEGLSDRRNVYYGMRSRILAALDADAAAGGAG